MPPSTSSAPAALAKLSQSPDFRIRFLRDELDAIDRLITYEDMGKVWKILQESTDSYLPDAFFDCCIDCPRQWARVSRVPAKLLAAQLEKIAGSAENLA
jgi:hypothetical protein